MKTKIFAKFISLNEYIRKERTHRILASKIKKELTESVAWQATADHLEPIKEYPVRIRFTWNVKDSRTDPDNIRFAAKYVLDGLVMAGILRDDGMSEIQEFEDHFVAGVAPECVGVDVEIEHASTN